MTKATVPTPKGMGELKTTDDLFSIVASATLATITKQRNWIEYVKSKDYKFSHPYDGFVNRDDNVIHFAHPQVKSDKLNVGDIGVLGDGYQPNQSKEVVLVEQLIDGKGVLLEAWRFKYL